MSDQRRPTLKDVSVAADVSVFTASRALVDHPCVAEPTRLRVHEAAARLGYVANRSARNLKGGASRTLGILTANNANLFYARLIKSVEKVVHAAGLHCYEVDAVEDGEYRIERENKFVETLLENRVAGILLTYIPKLENLRTLSAWRLPLVFIDCEPPEGFGRFPSIMSDNRVGSLLVGRHFDFHGYKSWLFVGHTAAWTSRRARESGFREAAQECGASVEVVEAGNDRSTAFEAVRQFFEARPKSQWPRALYASNEPLLNGALGALRALNIQTPGEVAVIGFDDFDWASLIDPPMTTVDQHIEELGRMAGEEMLALLEAESGPVAVRRLTQPTLCLRQSCGCIAAASREREPPFPRMSAG
jgi:LacI family transcriptional regulator